MNNFGTRRKVSAFISYVASDNQASNYHQLLRDHLRKNGIENVWVATDMSAGEEWGRVPEFTSEVLQGTPALGMILLIALIGFLSSAYFVVTSPATSG